MRQTAPTGMTIISRTTSGFLALMVAAVAAVAGVHAASDRSATPKPGSTLTVERSTVGNPIPGGFVGLSMEFRGLASYAGLDPKAPSPVFEQLLRNLAPGQSPVLRIGGDGTDWTWYPVPGIARPGGVKYDITKAWLGTVRSVAEDLNARVILGVNLEANSTRVASAEANAEVSQIGRKWIRALEIGNEPELYGTFSWYKTASGQHIDGRPAGYDYTAFLGDYARMVKVMPPGVALAGPSSGSLTYLAALGGFLTDYPRVRVATIHRYPLKHCGTSTATIGDLLSNDAAQGLGASVASYVPVVHARHVPLRIDELNAITCGGVRGVSDSFASALWAVDALFSLARTGVDGVNFHTVPKTINELVSSDFVHGHWRSFVHPQYYGMMLFAQAAPAGSRLLRIAGAPAPGVHAWATRGREGAVRVVLINKSQSRGQVVKLKIPGAHGPGVLERLRAASARATSGVTLGGESFGSETTTGRLAGTPSTDSVTATGGGYVITVPAASAALLTIAG
jgi:hypothetical protein